MPPIPLRPLRPALPRGNGSRPSEPNPDRSASKSWTTSSPSSSIVRTRMMALAVSGVSTGWATCGPAAAAGLCEIAVTIILPFLLSAVPRRARAGSGRPASLGRAERSWGTARGRPLPQGKDPGVVPHRYPAPDRAIRHRSPRVWVSCHIRGRALVRVATPGPGRHAEALQTIKRTMIATITTTRHR